MTTRAKFSGSEFSSGTTASSLSDPQPAPVGGAFALSACLHGGVAALLVFAAWTLREEVVRDAEFVLVPAPSVAAGGTRGGEASDAAETAPDFRAAMQQRQRAEEQRAQREISRMREQRRIAEAREAAEEAARLQTTESVSSRTAPARDRRTISHEEFLRTNRNQSAQQAAQQTSAVPARRDAEQVAGPRIHLREVGDAFSGPAGTPRPAANAGERTMDAYFRDLLARLKSGHEKPDGLSDLLSAEVLFTLAASGAISEVRITRSSGNPSFDQSVLEVFARVRMPARPDGKSNAQRLTFRLTEQ